MAIERLSESVAGRYKNDPRTVAEKFLIGKRRMHPGGELGYKSKENAINKWAFLQDPELVAEVVLEDNLGLTDDEMRFMLTMSSALKSLTIEAFLGYYQLTGTWPKDRFHLPGFLSKYEDVSDESFELGLKIERTALEAYREDLLAKEE